jgi:hypothetical protein
MKSFDQRGPLGKAVAARLDVPETIAQPSAEALAGAELARKFFSEEAVEGVDNRMQGSVEIKAGVVADYDKSPMLDFLPTYVRNDITKLGGYLNEVVAVLRTTDPDGIYEQLIATYPENDKITFAIIKKAATAAEKVPTGMDRAAIDALFENELLPDAQKIAQKDVEDITPEELASFLEKADAIQTTEAVQATRLWLAVTNLRVALNMTAQTPGERTPQQALKELKQVVADNLII